MRDNDLPVGEITVFLTSLFVNLAIAVVLFVVLGGRDLMSRRIDADDPEAEPESDSPDDRPVRPRAADPAASPTSDVAGRSLTPRWLGSSRAEAATTATAETSTAQRVSVDQIVTLGAFLIVAVVALAFDRNIGFTAITAAVVLTALSPAAQKGAVSQIAWSTVLLVAGVSTFATILQTAGVPEYVGGWAAGLGAAVVGALILCYVGGVVSAFASSTALLPIIIPIAIPLIVTGDISAVALVAALAVSSTIVDVSPFSTNGALMVANRPDSIDEEKFYRQILSYSAIVVAVGPLLVWAVVVAPGWL